MDTLLCLYGVFIARDANVLRLILQQDLVNNQTAIREDLNSIIERSGVKEGTTAVASSTGCLRVEDVFENVLSVRLTRHMGRVQEGVPDIRLLHYPTNLRPGIARRLAVQD